MHKTKPHETTLMSLMQLPWKTLSSPKEVGDVLEKIQGLKFQWNCPQRKWGGRLFNSTDSSS